MIRCRIKWERVLLEAWRYWDAIEEVSGKYFLVNLEEMANERSKEELRW